MPKQHCKAEQGRKPEWAGFLGKPNHIPGSSAGSQLHPWEISIFLWLSLLSEGGHQHTFLKWFDLSSLWTNVYEQGQSKFSFCTWIMPSNSWRPSVFCSKCTFTWVFWFASVAAEGNPAAVALKCCCSSVVPLELLVSTEGEENISGD